MQTLEQQEQEEGHQAHEQSQGMQLPQHAGATTLQHLVSAVVNKRRAAMTILVAVAATVAAAVAVAAVAGQAVAGATTGSTVARLSQRCMNKA